MPYTPVSTLNPQILLPLWLLWREVRCLNEHRLHLITHLKSSLSYFPCGQADQSHTHTLELAQRRAGEEAQVILSSCPTLSSRLGSRRIRELPVAKLVLSRGTPHSPALQRTPGHLMAPVELGMSFLYATPQIILFCPPVKTLSDQ